MTSQERNERINELLDNLTTDLKDLKETIELGLKKRAKELLRVYMYDEIIELASLL